MTLSVEIDPGSGFCNGVVRAVRQAEAYISTGVTAEIAAQMEALTEKPAE